MSGTTQEQGRIAWIIPLVLLYNILNSIPGPIDDAAVAARPDQKRQVTPLKNDYGASAIDA